MAMEVVIFLTFILDRLRMYCVWKDGTVEEKQALRLQPKLANICRALDRQTALLFELLFPIKNDLPSVLLNLTIFRGTFNSMAIYRSHIGNSPLIVDTFTADRNAQIVASYKSAGVGGKQGGAYRGMRLRDFFALALMCADMAARMVAAAGDSAKIVDLCRELLGCGKKALFIPMQMALDLGLLYGTSFWRMLSRSVLLNLSTTDCEVAR